MNHSSNRNQQGSLNLKHPDVPSLAHGILVIMVCIGILVFARRWLNGLTTILLANLLYILVPIWACYMFQFEAKRTLFLRFLRGRGVIGVVLGFVGMFTFIVVLSSILNAVPALQPDPEAKKRFLKRVESIRSIGWPGFFLIFAVLIPVSEEILFRGFLLRSARESMGITGAVLATSLFFGLLHRLSYARMIVMSLFGVYLAVAVWESRSLLTSLVLHAGNNFLVLALDEFSGANGVELNVVDVLGRFEQIGALLVSLVLITISLYLFRRNRRDDRQQEEKAPEEDAIYRIIFGP